MIAGTLVIEGLSIHFRCPDVKSGPVVVHVQEGLGGESARIECTPRAFAASIALALDFDGMDSPDGAHSAAQTGLYELAETIPWPSNNLRWIP